MKLVDINGRFLTQATTGVQRFATEIVRAIDQLLTADAGLRSRYAFRLLTPPDASRSVFTLDHIPTIPVGRLKGQMWEQFVLPRYSAGRLLLNLCNTAPLSTRSVVTLHDASVFAVPQAYSWAFGWWYRTLIPRLGRRALRVLTISAFSRDELSTRGRILASKIEIVAPGGDHILKTSADSGIFARVPVQPGRYVLAVGSRSPHKNVAAVVSAVARLNGARLPLVTAGGANSRVFSKSASLRSDAVHAAGYVSDGELRALYENALCLVYPSLYEGFGLPPLEAMACGCPAIVAQAASLPEVCGDAALYCNPRDPEDIARKIELIQEPSRRSELRSRGLERAQQFTWRAAAETLFRIIDRLRPV